MKKRFKLIAIFLAMVILISSLTACLSEGDDENDDPSGEQTTENTEVKPSVEKKNYNEDLYLQSFATLDYLWVEDSGRNVVTEALYERQINLETYLGVTMYGKVTEGNHNTYYNYFANSVKLKDGSIDIFHPDPYNCISMIIQGGYCRDLKTLDGLNLTADYWNTEYMDSISVDGKYYLGYSDFNIPKAFVIVFNKEMYEKYGSTLDESLYQTVQSYRWTVDKMISLANLVYTDNAGDGKTQDDIFGISGKQWLPFITFLHASDIKLVEEDETGAYKISVLNEKNSYKTSALVDKFKELAKSDCSWFTDANNTIPTVDITSGRVLMSLASTNGLDRYLDYGIEFGVLPYPMYDELQASKGYISLNYDGYIVVPSYLRNEQMVADSLDVLSFYSAPVRTAVFEKLLGKQVADMPEDAQMLDIIWDGICSDFGLTYARINDGLLVNLYMFPNLTKANATDSLASFVASYESTSNKAISKYLKLIEKLDD